MKLKVFKTARPNTTYLQGIGHVEGTPAGSLKVGNTLIWNNGAYSTVVEIVKETPKTITILEEYPDSISTTGTSTFERKLLKKRIVARPAIELPGKNTDVEVPMSYALTSSQADDQVPSEGSGTDQRDGVVLVTSGPDVDQVTELFDNPDRDKLLNGTWEVTEETEFDRLAALNFPDEPKPDDPEYYPNQVTFDRVLNLYPGFKVVGVEEFYTPATGWVNPKNIIGEHALEHWKPEELVQYLADSFKDCENPTFCLLIESNDGKRLKNPDYKLSELLVGLEVDDRVLYESRPGRQEEGIVSSIKVKNGTAKVWVRYSTGSTGALTPLVKLSKA